MIYKLLVRNIVGGLNESSRVVDPCMGGREVLELELGMQGVMLSLKIGFLKSYKCKAFEQIFGSQRMSL